MTYINANIQDGFLLRRGFRGRFLTVYLHRYSGKREVTERYHSHPWLFSFGIVLLGVMKEDVTGKGFRWRYPPKISWYLRQTSHRIKGVTPGTTTLFVGLFRTQEESPSATTKCKEGYCHYSEVSGDIVPPDSE